MIFSVAKMLYEGGWTAVDPDAPKGFTNLDEHRWPLAIET